MFANLRLICFTEERGTWQKSLSTGVATHDDLDKFVNLELGYLKGISEYVDKCRKFRYESDQFLIELVKEKAARSLMSARRL